MVEKIKSSKECFSRKKTCQQLGQKHFKINSLDLLIQKSLIILLRSILGKLRRLEAKVGLLFHYGQI